VFLSVLTRCLAKPITLEWNDVSLKIARKSDDFLVLDGISGAARPGRLLAIMGPSGSGKSSLLLALAGQVADGRKGSVKLSGELVVNGSPISEGRLADFCDVAFVKQDDLFYSQMTVRETLMFAARLRLPRTTSLAQKTTFVETLMNKLNLLKSADTIVGNAKVRGISGGERKRLSIACELISRPSLLFLDEPTSGLDSFQAERLIEALATLAKETVIEDASAGPAGSRDGDVGGGGNTIACVIHQPSAAVFNMFDDIVLLGETGRCLYSGPRIGMQKHFKAAGFHAPPGTTVAEWVLRLASIDAETTETRSESRLRLNTLAAANKESATRSQAAQGGIKNKESSPDGNVEWAPSGDAAARRAPFFVRGLVRRKTEVYARERDIAVIDESVVLAAKRGHDDEVNADDLRTNDSSVAVTAASGAACQSVAKKQVIMAKVSKYPATMREQYSLLFARAWREVARGKLPVFIKVVQQVSTALIFGAIYSLDDSQISIQNRFGLLSLVCTGAANIGVASTIRSFPKEKTIVFSERAKKIYPVAPYFFSKLVAEIPLSVFLSSLGGCLLYPLVGFQRTLPKFLRFLGITGLQSFTASALGMLIGASAPDSDAALAMFPPLVVLMVIFNGFNINEKSTPKALRWLPQLSLIRWGFEGLAINEFTGLKFPPPQHSAPNLAFGSSSHSENPHTKGLAQGVATGEEALGRLGLDTTKGTDLRHAVKSQAALLAGCYAGTFAVLRRQKPRFAAMSPQKRPRYSY